MEPNISNIINLRDYRKLVTDHFNRYASASSDIYPFSENTGSDCPIS